MKNQSHIISLLMFMVLGMLSISAYADDDDGKAYAITITNITKGQIFTPILAVTHKRGLNVLSLGSAASGELEQLAEGGNVVPLETAMFDSGKAFDSAVSDPLPPGHSTTLHVKMKGKYDYISLASMLIPTNDAFIALNGVRGPKGKKYRTFMVPAYDAGTEINDEVCDHIPGPDCGGEGYNAEGGEGFVHIHNGMHGIGTLEASTRDWRNPVAKIVIKRVK